MGIENIILFLIPPLIIAMIIRSVELSIAAIGISGAIVLAIQASKPDASLWWALAFILYGIAGVGALFHAIQTAVKEHNFKDRVDSYIAEGQRIVMDKDNPNICTMQYITLGRDWSNKVSEDIRKHKGQAEMEGFLAKGTTEECEHRIEESGVQDKYRREAVAKIVSTQKTQLELLRKRL
ncbi:hypothetical protein ACFLWR_03340 [Chloroflexota bacterium]